MIIIIIFIEKFIIYSGHSEDTCNFEFWCKNYKTCANNQLNLDWSFHASKPRTITVDKNPAYPIAITGLKKEKKMPLGIQIRQIKHLNNIVEQDHRFIKKRIHSMLGFKSFRTATSILAGVEAMHMIKKTD